MVELVRLGEASVRHLEERKTEWFKAHEPLPDAERIRSESCSRNRLVETLRLK